jgi:hypothetical protein
MFDSYSASVSIGGVSSDLDRLGRRHKQLRQQLEDLKPELHEAMRAERAGEVTYREIMERSGYHTIQQVREICMTGEQRRVERDKRRQRTTKERP